jgi:hypothetical protein
MLTKEGRKREERDESNQTMGSIGQIVGESGAIAGSGQPEGSEKGIQEEARGRQEEDG